MAVIHNTTLVPSKLEIMAPWMSSRPWFQGPGPAQLVRSGGFRLDDPAGEVGMELHFVVDSATDVVYLVPMTYRGAPLPDMDDALIGTMEHGVLGKRWAYDGCRDDVLISALVQLIDGRAVAQHQTASNTPAPDVTRACTIPIIRTAASSSTIDGPESSDVPVADGRVLRFNRVLRQDVTIDPSAVGWIHCTRTTVGGDPVPCVVASVS